MHGVTANPPAGSESVSDAGARAEAERSGRPFLVFRDRDERQHVFLFAPGATEASVGRLPTSDLVLAADDQVSRMHARFELAGDAWELVDDGFSSNGTFINGQRLQGRRRLNDGDNLRFGMTSATLHLPAPARPAGPPSPVTPAVELSTTQRRVLVALCRPYKGREGFASPADDQQIADELVLSVSEVRRHLKVLYAKLELTQAPPAEIRVRLAERGFSAGLVSEGDL
jgi:hypothetical protein